MIKTTLAGLRAHKLRLVATAMAIVLGVGFVAGTMIFGDTAKASLYDEFARAAQHVDLTVFPPAAASGKSTGHTVAHLPVSAVDTMRAVPGVGAVDGRMQDYLALLDKHGKLVTNGGGPGLALSAGTVPALRPYDVTAGRVPARIDEVALDTDSSAYTGYALGDVVTVLDSGQQRHALTLVGTVSFGAAKQYSGQSVLILTQDAMTSLTGDTGYSQLVVSGGPGTSAGALLRRAGAALPGDQIITGTQYRQDLANRAMNQLDNFLTVLLIFAIIACVVSAFVIYNTFNILLAQRVRDMALLRCVGASRGQIFGSVVLESVAVGLVGAGLGIAAGIGLGYALFGGASALGTALPSHAVVVTAAPVLVALLIGVLVTVASALIPALRATRVPALAALRTLPPEALRNIRGRLRLIVFAVLVGGLGTALTVDGCVTTAGARTATLLVVVGGMVNFLAVLILAPLFIGPLTAAIGALPARVFGTPVRLAVANARRNPGRTAATTAALMIGVGLMAAATVGLSTVKATATEQLAVHYPVDYILQPNTGDQQNTGIPPLLAQRLRQQSELGTVAEVRTDAATLDGRSLTLGTINTAGPDPLIGKALPLTAGSTAGFGPGTVILFTSAPAAQGKRVGDRVTLAAQGGRRGTFRVVALASGESQTGDAVVDWTDFGTLHPSSVDDLVLIRADAGVSPARSRAAVASVTDDYPLVSLQSIADWRAEITRTIDSIISVIAALLAVAVLIALIGIMNTLSLSVFERTRESALTRALGLTRGQLRATLLAEALLMGAVGGIVGIGFGLLYGWITSQVLFTGFAAVVSIPGGQLLGYLGVAVAAAVLAAVLPARRAARVSVVTAMAER